MCSSDLLPKVRRVYVDKFTGGLTAAQMREMIIASLQGAKLFVVTENEDRADAFLRGTAEDLIYTELHQMEDNIDMRLSGGRGRTAQGTTSSSRTSRNTDNYGLSIGERESSRIQERKHEASASVRLVLKNGDVIWSTIQESSGGKFRGASADVADRITRQLVLDHERAKRLKPPPDPPPAPVSTATSGH